VSVLPIDFNGIRPRLCVGGPWHGKERVMPGDYLSPIMEAHILEGFGMRQLVRAGEPDHEVNRVILARYRRETIRCGTFDMVFEAMVWVWDEFHDKEEIARAALGLLLTGIMVGSKIPQEHDRRRP
jgi:hypothetical protein